MLTLLVHFYNPVLDKDGVLNKLVAYADPPYCHCELEFADGQSCAVYMGGKVHLKTRQFDPKSYDTVRVQCTTQQHARAQQLARDLEAEKQAFSRRAMLASKFTAIAVPDTRAFTCCSKLCCEILQEASVLSRDTVAARLTPSMLCAVLTHPLLPVCETTVIDFRPCDRLFNEVP